MWTLISNFQSHLRFLCDCLHCDCAATLTSSSYY